LRKCPRYSSSQSLLDIQGLRSVSPLHTEAHTMVYTYTPPYLLVLTPFQIPLTIYRKSVNAVIFVCVNLKPSPAKTHKHAHLHVSDSSQETAGSSNSQFLQIKVTSKVTIVNTHPHTHPHPPIYRNMLQNASCKTDPRFSMYCITVLHHTNVFFISILFLKKEK